MLEVTDLWAGYSPKDPCILQGISFKAQSGGITGILGPNGSGKTTLLLALGGLLKARQGTVRWQGGDLSALTRRAHARLSASVPQNPGYQPMLTAFDFVLMGRYARSGGLSTLTGYSQDDKQKALRALEAANCGAFAARTLGRLSGGERQRVFIARALAQETPLLLLDEPSSSLDPGHGAALFALLQRLCKENALCVLVGLHDINMASLYCAEIVLLRHGRQIAAGKPAEVFTKEMLHATYDAALELVPHPVCGLPQVLPAHSEFI